MCIRFLVASRPLWFRLASISRHRSPARGTGAVLGRDGVYPGRHALRRNTVVDDPQHHAGTAEISPTTPGTGHWGPAAHIARCVEPRYSRLLQRPIFYQSRLLRRADPVDLRVFCLVLAPDRPTR